MADQPELSDFMKPIYFELKELDRPYFCVVVDGAGAGRDVRRGMKLRLLNIGNMPRKVLLDMLRCVVGGFEYEELNGLPDAGAVRSEGTRRDG